MHVGGMRHAADKLAERGIDRIEAERTILMPTATKQGHGDRTVYLRKYLDRALGQTMLLCVVTELDVDTVVIVTAYKTSRLDKYLKGTGHEDPL